MYFVFVEYLLVVTFQYVVLVSVLFLDIYIEFDPNYHLANTVKKRDNFHIDIIKFATPWYNIPTAPAYGVGTLHSTFLCIFTFLVPSCDVTNYEFRIKLIFSASLPPTICRRAHVLCPLFVVLRIVVSYEYMSSMIWYE